MKNDSRETRNVYAEHPDVVKRLEAEITRIIQQGRSTPGPAQANDGAAWWRQLTWIKPQTGQ